MFLLETELLVIKALALVLASSIWLRYSQSEKKEKEGGGGGGWGGGVILIFVKESPMVWVVLKRIEGTHRR